MSVDPYAGLLIGIEEPPDLAPVGSPPPATDWPTAVMPGTAGSTGSVGPVGSSPRVPVLSGSTGSVGPVGSNRGVLDDVRKWLARFICTMDDADLDLLTLWAAHTHLCDVVYTTPRLVLDSPLPGAGKTTTCEHLARLCRRPLQAASLSSPAMLARVLDKELRTIIVDEVDRNLDPKRPGVNDLIAIINAGYKRGATRPVLVPGPKGEWDVREMPTFSPVVLAGNAPNLPEDTRSRTIRVLLLPDLEGRVETSDWEEIEPDAVDLAAALAEWADEARDLVSITRPELPEGCVGRAKERWSPLRRVAEVAGGRWPQVADELIRRDLVAAQLDREDGMVTEKPTVHLLRDLHEHWPADRDFVATSVLLELLILGNPRQWGPDSAYGRALTAQRLGRMLAQGFKVNSTRQGDGPRGYYRQAIAPVWRRMGVTPRSEPTEPTEPARPAGEPR